MLQRSTQEQPIIALRSNWLTVDKHKLRADVLEDPKSKKVTTSAEELSAYLLLGRHSILQGIEKLYHQYPGASRQSIWTAQLGTEAQTEGRDSKVFTEPGYANGGINTSIDEIQPDFHDHWKAVLNAGFLPEVRRTDGRADGGSWLLLRKPLLTDVLKYWFGHEDDLRGIAAAILNKDKELEKANLLEYRLRGEEAVDTARSELRPREQVALLLSMAAIKATLGNLGGSKKEIDDALDYARNDASIEDRAVRAIENSAFGV